MKKISSLFVALLFLCSVVSAVEITGQVGKQVEITRNAEGDLTVTGERAQTASELREAIQNRQQELDQEMAGIDRDEKKTLTNQNRIRLAVHSLLAMEDLVGGVGKRVSEMAREFDNSAEKTIEAENSIRARSSFARIFAGGDEKAAEEIEENVKANKVRIELMKQLKNECDCGSEVKAMFQEQITNMEVEFTRLQKLSEEEKQSKGLFGWLWNK